MERGKEGPLSQSRSASQPHGHAPSHRLLVNHENRKPLFANAPNAAAQTSGPRSTTGFEARYATNAIATGLRSRPPSGPDGPGPPSLARRAKSDPPGAPVSEMSDGTGTGGVYLPRKTVFRSPAARRLPGSETRGLQGLRPLSIKEAFRIAQEEQQEAERQRQLGGSPSPAPRPWRARPGQPQDEVQARQLLAEDHLDGKMKSTTTSNVAAMSQNDHRPLGIAGLGAIHQGADGPAASAAVGGGSPKRFGTGNPSLQDRINAWRTSSRPVVDPARTGPSPGDVADFGGTGRLPALVPGIEDDGVPLPAADESPRPKFEVASSPSKDFSWQVEQDFTAGDLQISNSPRIKVGANSNKPFANRPSIFNGIHVRSPARSPARVKSPERSNTRIMDIQEDEMKHGVDNTAGNSGLKNLTKLRQERQHFSRMHQENHAQAAEGPLVDSEKGAVPPLASTSSDRSLPRPKMNEKLNTIRQLETTGLSKRALAEIRLAEIKEQNAMARPLGSKIPKHHQQQQQHHHPGTSTTRSNLGSGGGMGGMGGMGRIGGLGGQGEHIPDTPVTIYKSYGRSNSQSQENTRSVWGAGATADADADADVDADKAVKKHATTERDLLRRLARAASASPAAAEPAGASLATTNKRAAPSELSSRMSSTARPSLAAGPSTFTDLGRKAAPLTFSVNNNNNNNNNNQTSTKAGTNTSSSTSTSTSTSHVPNREPKSKSFKSSFSTGSSNRFNIRFNDGPLIKPTVGFAGLRRANSAESVKSKRSSMQSEADPTARIEGEMKLFALADNQSERGSIRAPSLGSDSDREEDTEHRRNDGGGGGGGGGDDDDDDDDGDEDDHLAETTPKPQKHDFVSMPTPKITGAFIETPVTVKPINRMTEDERRKEEEGEDEDKLVKPFREKLKEQRERQVRDGKKNQAHRANMLGDTKAADPSRHNDDDAASDPGTTSGRSHQDDETAAAAALQKKKARARSVPRERARAPLKNSAKLPSARDDLRELQRRHNMDDSTVEDVEELLAGQKRASRKIRELLEQGPSRAELDDAGVRLLDEEVKQEWDEKGVKREEKEEEEENEEKGEKNKASDRRSSTLVSRTDSTVRSDSREATKGMERLEGEMARVAEKLSSHTVKPTKPSSHLSAPPQNKDKVKKTENDRVVKTQHKDRSQPTSETSETSETYLHIPLPYLWHASPRLGFTWLGRLLAMLLVWFVAEQALCALYCRPATCVSTPCVYSYDDPTLGYALPVKLDQWTTGGHGRRVLHRIHEDLQDLVADMQDALTGRSIQDIPVEQVPVPQRRQHWRRLRKRGLLRNASTLVGLGSGSGSGSGSGPGSEQKAKWDAWRRSRLARQRARDRDMEGGLMMEEEEEEGWVGESMTGDERVW
ncbi:hypothetical protein E4U43_004545 [Claviceps pusilla]|uniref:Uncharacterized protein n=1 Tax=Claviceps pusilla TaxID=123648 RepID=A0A9P7STW4_9HYPO|nr:hypothetical protein E4U43_004545 [Claviceps pusilla]